MAPPPSVTASKSSKAQQCSWDRAPSGRRKHEEEHPLSTLRGPRFTTHASRRHVGLAPRRSPFTTHDPRLTTHDFRFTLHASRFTPFVGGDVVTSEPSPG